MPRLVALDLAGGPDFVEALQRVWDRGDAVFPVDQRLPSPARRTLLRAMAPASVIDATGDEQRLADGRPVEDGDALVVATSGSTGAPKGVVLTHDAVAASARATSGALGVGPDDRWLACLPLAHVGGLSVVTRALLTGTPLTVLPGFDPDAVGHAARSGCTLVSLVGTALTRIDARLFRLILLGGGRPPVERPPNTVATYGMTETGSGIVYEGRPLPGVEIHIDDAGEIHVRGPMLLRAYRDGVDPKDADGWLPTGDLGSWRPDGRLCVAGRRGELIITGGENVWPEVVESALRSHPGVADVAVTGRDDPEWGQRVVAFVVPADRTRPPTLDDLRAHVKAQLPAFCAPREVQVVAGLPRTALGKIRRSELGAPSD